MTLRAKKLQFKLRVYTVSLPLFSIAFLSYLVLYFLLVTSFTTGSAGTFILLRWSMQSLLFLISHRFLCYAIFYMSSIKNFQFLAFFDDFKEGGHIGHHLG